MPHLDFPHFLSILVCLFVAAKLLGGAARLIGQPSVLGELTAGVVLGASVLGVVDPKQETLHLLAELGVLILLFEIGLETDLKHLLQVGGASAVVAFVGAVLPFALGYALCRMLGQGELTSIVSGAALTATSVGITARVLSELNRLGDSESRVILGAAVIDDVLGLIVLAVVSDVASGAEVTPLGVAGTTAAAFGFLIGSLVIGRFIVTPAAKRFDKLDLPGSPAILAVAFAMGLAYLASVAGSAPIIGAFAAGVLLRETPQAHDVERGVAQLGKFFVPIFFVTVGAAVDLRQLNPAVAENRDTLIVGGLLIVVAVIGKFVAGYAPWWYRGKKHVIGIGMIPRGEVGLIFAQMGLATGAFDVGFFSAVTMMVMVTTFLAPPLLKFTFPPLPTKQPALEPEGIEELVSEP